LRRSPIRVRRKNENLVVEIGNDASALRHRRDHERRLANRDWLAASLRMRGGVFHRSLDEQPCCPIAQRTSSEVVCQLDIKAIFALVIGFAADRTSIEN